VCALSATAAKLHSRWPQPQVFSISCAGELTRSWDLDTFGPVYALTAGPYGSLLALTWDKASQSATILHLGTASDDETAGAQQRSISLNSVQPGAVSVRLRMPATVLRLLTAGMLDDRALLVLTAAVADGPLPTTYILSVIAPSAGSGLLDSLELGGVHSPNDIALSARNICESFADSGFINFKTSLYAAGSARWTPGCWAACTRQMASRCRPNNHMQVFEELVIRSETEGAEDLKGLNPEP